MAACSPAHTFSISRQQSVSLQSPPTVAVQQLIVPEKHREKMSLLKRGGIDEARRHMEVMFNPSTLVTTKSEIDIRLLKQIKNKTI